MPDAMSDTETVFGPFDFFDFFGIVKAGDNVWPRKEKGNNRPEC
jgi:hypothetical protein